MLKYVKRDRVNILVIA